MGLACLAAGCQRVPAPQVQAAAWRRRCCCLLLLQRGGLRHGLHWRGQAASARSSQSHPGPRGRGPAAGRPVAHSPQQKCPAGKQGRAAALAAPAAFAVCPGSADPPHVDRQEPAGQLNRAPQAALVGHHQPIHPPVLPRLPTPPHCTHLRRQEDELQLRVGLCKVKQVLHGHPAVNGVHEHIKLVLQGRGRGRGQFMPEWAHRHYTVCQR